MSDHRKIFDVLDELEEQVLDGLAKLKPLSQISTETNLDVLQIAEVISHASAKLGSASIAQAVAIYSAHLLKIALEEPEAQTRAASRNSMRRIDTKHASWRSRASRPAADVVGSLWWRSWR